MNTALGGLVDPLASWMATRERPAATLLPLMGIRYDIDILGGLAVVRTARTFQHREEDSLEAILVFPVPLRAALFALEVEIDGRRLRARARSREEAREDYEEAIDAGKTAVLHEEVLRGVHMLSVGHLPPNKRVEVVTQWAMPLVWHDGDALLRVPLTVGEIYGDPKLPETDAPTHAPLSARARLQVSCPGARVWLDGRRVDGEIIEIPIDTPIELRVERWRPQTATGRSADGRAVVLEAAPEPRGEGALDLAILVDHSGSMEECVEGGAVGLTKHQSVRRALSRMASALRPGDRVELWQFDDRCERIGATWEPFGVGDRGEDGPAARMARLVNALDGPRGGTELGRALARVIAESRCRDLLVLTDGKSWALDVEALARQGKRICAVLVGEDSLEAMIGHLAALTGGGLHLAFRGAVHAALEQALGLLRRQHRPPLVEGAPERLDVVVDGVRFRARWGEVVSDGERSWAERAVAALAAALALPGLNSVQARELALAEGLVTHQTSLVLVDEAGAIQEGLPRTVKIPLATPRTGAPEFPLLREARLMRSIARMPSKLMERAYEAHAHLEQDRIFFAGRKRAVRPSGGILDWSRTSKLARGDLSDLHPLLAATIRRLARLDEVEALARRLGIDPVLLVLLAIARIDAKKGQRNAQRFLRRLLPPAAGKAKEELRILEEIVADAFNPIG